MHYSSSAPVADKMTARIAILHVYIIVYDVAFPLNLKLYADLIVDLCLLLLS